MVELEVEQLKQELEKNKIKLKELNKNSVLRENLAGGAAICTSGYTMALITKHHRGPFISFIPIFFMTPVMVGIPTSLLVSCIRPIRWYYEHKQLLLSQKLYNLKEKDSSKKR